MQDHKVGNMVWESELSLLDKNLCNILQFVDDLSWGIELDYIMSLTVLSHSDSFFYVFSSRRSFFWTILIFLTNGCFADCCDFGVFMREIELTVFYSTTLSKSEKASLKLNIQKTKIMASGPILSWQIDVETMETVTDFIFLHSKITADGNFSHKIKICLLLGRKVMANLDSILKSRDITLPKKVCLVKAIVFPVVMNGCESWTIKKAEHQRIDAFELWCWRRLLSPLDCKEIQPVHPKGNQS